MRALIQRVKSARVTVQEKVIGSIEQGVVLFLGIHAEDHQKSCLDLALKVASLRIFEDEHGKINKSVEAICGKFLVISQFTLYGDCTSGRRPSFTEAMNPKDALIFYETFIHHLRESVGADRVECGAFGAHMEVHLVNDGPFTLLISK